MPSISENHSFCNESKNSMRASSIGKSGDQLSQPSQFFSSDSVTHLIQPKCEPVETDFPVSSSSTDFNISVCSDSFAASATGTDDSSQICKTEYFVQEPLPTLLIGQVSNYSEIRKLPEVKIENIAENPACSLPLSEVNRFSISNQQCLPLCKEEVQLDPANDTNPTLNTLDTCQTQCNMKNIPDQIKPARTIKDSQKFDNPPIIGAKKRQRSRSTKKRKGQRKSSASNGKRKKFGERDSNGQLIYRCPVPGCDRAFNSRNSFHWHADWHNGTNFVCDYCNKKFYRKFTLTRHIEIHMGEGIQHACHIAQCGRVFKRADNLNRHLLTHNGNKKFLCAHCNKGLARKEHLIRHIKTHMKIMSNIANGSDNDLFKQLTRKKCPCPNCNVEGGNKTRDSNGKPQHICHYPDCGKIFNETSGLKDHLARHCGKKKFVCTTCNRPYTTKSNLVAHMKIHAAVRTTFECPHCDKNFFHKQTLKFHLQKHEMIQQKEARNKRINKPKVQNCYNLRLQKKQH